MSYVILDIETRPNEELKEIFFSNIKAPRNIKDPAKIEAAIAKKVEAAVKEMAVDLDFSEIICIGVKEEGKEPMLMNLREYTDWLNTPKELKETGSMEGSGYVKNMHQKIVTFNGKAFDVPILIKCAIKEGIEDFPYTYFSSLMDKYGPKNVHVDLMNEIGMVYGKHKSLDTYLQIYLGIAKKPIDFDTATEEEIREHAIEDVINTEKLYKKFEPLILS